jgi:hypothetical protein
MKLYKLVGRVFPSWRGVEPFRSMDPKALPVDSILHATYVACGQDILRRAVEGAVIGALPGLYFLRMIGRGKGTFFPGWDALGRG